MMNNKELSEVTQFRSEIYYKLRMIEEENIELLKLWLY